VTFMVAFLVGLAVLGGYMVGADVDQMGFNQPLDKGPLIAGLCLMLGGWITVTFLYNRVRRGRSE